MPNTPVDSSTRARHEQFVTTHWSVVMAAAHGENLQAGAALEKLCETYWYPLYAFVRRLGRRSHDAEDVVQGFFAQCVEKNYLQSVDQAKGRFRSFLLLALKRYLAKEHEKSHARKRGGGQTMIALDAFAAEQRYALEPAEQLSADKLYERRWALTLLDQVLSRLREEQAAAGRLEAFEQMKEFLQSGGRGTPYSELASRLGASEGSVKVAIHRLRRRYRELLEEEIAHTVATAEEVAEERRHLRKALSG
jgi:RNA polymerase sigma-70 factor (ECF subfamily)